MGTPRYETPLTFLLSPQTFLTFEEQAHEISKISCSLLKDFAAEVRCSEKLETGRCLGRPILART
jgi:hypothetical protein